MGDGLHIDLECDEFDFTTDHVCAYCEANLDLLEEVLLLQVVYPNRVNGHDEFYDLENDAGTSYEYTPYYFHMECWEEIGADLDTHNEEVAALAHEYGIHECDSCTSDILAWELTGLLTEGEFRTSQRAPNGEPTTYFHSNTKPRCYCAACLLHVNNEILEMWENFSHNGECQDGTLLRCWRSGMCCNGCVISNQAAE